MSNIAPYNISSEISTSSDNFELTYEFLWDEILPEYFESTVIEAVSLPSLNPLPNNELYQQEIIPNPNNNYMDISNSIKTIHLETENVLLPTNQNNLNNTNYQDNSNGANGDSNAYIIKLMNAEKECKELDDIKQRLENEHLQLNNENDEIKRDIIEFIKANNIQFDKSIIKNLKKRKSSAKSFTSLPSNLSSFSPVPSTSTCSNENPRRSRGRPHKDLAEETREFEKKKPNLDKYQLRIASNNVASIRARENKKNKLFKLYAEEQELIKLNKDLNTKYRRNRKYILRIIKAAVNSAENYCTSGTTKLSF